MTIAEGVQVGKGRQATPRGPLTAARGVSRGASLTAGMGLLVMTLLAVFANFVVLEGLVTPGDAEQTARDIAGSQGLFRWGIAAFIVVVALDVVVAVALFALFAPVSRSVSRLAAAFRIGYAAVFAVAISRLVGVLPVSGDADRTLAGTDAFSAIWQAGLVLFGIHLLLIGYLVLRSGSVPKIIGIALAVAGIGYLADAAGTLLIPGYSISIAAVTGIGEVVLMVWLLINGRRPAIATPVGTAVAIPVAIPVATPIAIPAAS